MDIKKVDTIGEGDALSRRRFLESLGVNTVAGIAALKLTGLSEGNVGLESDSFLNHPFKAIGGYVDNGKLLLPSGCGVSLGQYGNPIIDPAPIHGAALEAVSPALFDRDSLSKNILRAKEVASDDQIADFVKSMRVFQILVKDGNGYRQWDLSAPSFEPPVVRIGSNGLLEIRQGNEVVVSPDDKYYLKMVYHEDINRFDRGAVIGIFEAGTPPTETNPIISAELDTPLLVSGASWKLHREGSAIQPEDLHGEFAPGVKFVRVGNNLWRYAYENGVFSAECRAHGGKADEEWSAMGQPIFYQLTQKGLDTVLIPEPDLGKAVDLRTLGLTESTAHATGIILWSVVDGGIRTERKSLTHLKNNGGTVSFDGTTLVWTEAGKAPRAFQIVELRSKPLAVGTAYDLYAVEQTAGIGHKLAGRPVCNAVGEFDMVEAYRAAQALAQG